MYRSLIPRLARTGTNFRMAHEPEPPYDFDFAPSKLPSEFLQAIGLMSVSWENLEHSISQAIGGLLNTDPAMTTAVTIHLSMPQKLDQLKALSEIRFGKSSAEHKKICGFIARIKASQPKRNSVVHNNWCIEKKSQKVICVGFSARGEMKVKFSAPTADQVKEDAKEVHALSLEIFMYLASNSLLPKIPGL